MSTKYGLTETYLQNQIKETSYQRYGDTGTLCVLTLQNGYTVTGTSGCIDPPFSTKSSDNALPSITRSTNCGRFSVTPKNNAGMKKPN